MGKRKAGRGNGGSGVEAEVGLEGREETVVETAEDGRRVRRYLMSFAINVERARVAGSYVGARTELSEFSSSANSSALRCQPPSTMSACWAGRQRV
jgi:hypothetical protein